MPISFTTMSKLTALELPREWSQLEGLTKLRLSRNPQLTPEKIPREWKQLRRKSQLDIGALVVDDDDVDEVEVGKVDVIEVLEKDKEVLAL